MMVTWSDVLYIFLFPKGGGPAALYSRHVEWLMLHFERSHLGNHQMYYFVFLVYICINDYLLLSWLIFRLMCVVYVWALWSSVRSA
jgi:hypothetical protein